MRFVWVAALVFGSSIPAQAAWQKVETDHFVIYADDSPKNARRFGEMLESFHSAMEASTGRKVGKPSPSNRVTIYALASSRSVQALAGDNSSTVQGFYVPRAGGSVAFVPDLRSTRGEPDPAMSVLLHEYAHHFLISSQRMPMPRWMSEGAAEFFSSASFESDGSVMLGKPNESRGYELAYSENVTIRQLLDEEIYAQRKSRGYSEFYGRSWLLYHYLTFDPVRKGQLERYWVETANGTPRIAAAEKVFGDLDTLDKEMNRYLKSRRMTVYSIPKTTISTGEISVAPVGAGLAEMMPVVTVSRRGVTPDQAKELLVKARSIAAKHPGDAAVLAALAEAEHDADNHAEAVATADRALAIDPNQKDALMQKGLALFALAEKAEKRAEAYTAAMKPFQALNRLEPDHPYPLIHFYRSFSARDAEPTETARHALERASQLAPFDRGLAFEVGQMLAWEGKVREAEFVLRPLTSDPHGGSMARTAAALIDFIKGKPQGEPVDLGAFVPPIDTEAGD